MAPATALVRPWVMEWPAPASGLLPCAMREWGSEESITAKLFSMEFVCCCEYTPAPIMMNETMTASRSLVLVVSVSEFIHRNVSICQTKLTSVMTSDRSI